MSKYKTDSSVKLFFTFYLRNFQLECNQDTLNKLENDLKQMVKIQNSTIEVHASGEREKDVNFIRRFLWGANPHLHFDVSWKGRKSGGLPAFPNFSVVKKDTNMQLRIATVTGGISGIELAIRNISPQNVISEVDLWVRDIKYANERPFQLSKWFVDIIRTYTNCLKTVGYFTNIDWKEYAENSLEEGGKETDLLIGVKRENNELKPTSLKDADAVFYQEPFVILEWEVNNLQDFCKNELRKTKKLFFGGEEIRTEGKIYGLEDIEIPKVARICFDPTRALVILNKRNSASLSIIPEIIHRVLFLLRTTMHFCILWDSRLQIFFQETNRILKGIEKAKDDTSKLFSYLEEVNNLSLRLSSTVAELFDSFVWRYPSFLPAQLGYLSTIHNKMDNILSVSIKTRNIRESVNELRQQITFAANIIREKLAEKLPQILSKVDSKEGKRKCQ